MNRKTIYTIFHKELKNAFRDKRTLYATFIVPLLLPALIILPMTLVNRNTRQIREKPSKVTILYPERFPRLAKALASCKGLLVVNGIENVEWGLREGYIDCALKIEKGPREGEAAEVLLLFDGTKESSSNAAERVRGAVRRFSEEIATKRLEQLGVSLQILHPIVLNQRNVATQAEIGGFLLGLLVAITAIVGTITGGMTLAIDATAGEKERKTLEVLLASPATRNELVAGKFFATLVMAMLSVFLLSFSLALSFHFGARIFAQLGEGITMKASLSAGAIALLLLALLLVASLIASVEMAISLFARSFREAQSYLTPLTIVAVLPVVFVQAIPSNPPSWVFLVPLFNTMLLIRELFMNIFEVTHIVPTILSSSVYALAGLSLAFRIFHRESVILR